MASYDSFEIDIVSALAEQLISSLEKLEIGSLSEEQLSDLPRGQGVYHLFHNGVLVYVGQAANLPKRLSEHYRKIGGRQNISVSEMGFKCLYVHPNWTALAPEKALIKHYQGGEVCEWNGNGFGPHDPGRDRETTNKPADGFDATYPIHADWQCDWIEAREWNGRDLLMAMKAELPYLLRYQISNKNRWRDGHPDYNRAVIQVPKGSMAACVLLKTIADQLNGWQATAFPGHMILYKEDRPYTHGEVL